MPSGQTRLARELRPRVAAVGRLEEAAARAAARHRVGQPVGLPQRGVEHLRVVAVHHEIDRAGLRVAVQHLLPGLPAVARPEHAALLVRTGHVAERRRVHEVRVRRADDDLRDDLRVGQPHVRPGLPGVGRLVDAVALHDVAAQADLAHADVDRVGARLGHGHRADRRARELAVGDRAPVGPAVGRLPQAAADRAEVVLVGPPDHAGRGDRAAAALGADAAPGERLEQGGGVGVGLRARRGGGPPRERRHRECQGQRPHEPTGLSRHLSNPPGGRAGSL